MTRHLPRGRWWVWVFVDLFLVAGAYAFWQVGQTAATLREGPVRVHLDSVGSGVEHGVARYREALRQLSGVDIQPPSMKGR